MSLLLHDFALTPNIPNKQMKSMLSLYLKVKFLTKSVLQNAREMAKREIFGLPHVNVQYATGLKTEMEAQGHNVLLIERDARYVRLMLERVVLQEEIELQKMNKVNMTANEKQTFLEEWREDNALLLMDGGLSLPAEGGEESKFFTGIIFSPSYCKDAVPELQDVYQVDACHLEFGKYTLYSLYGTTANCNTFPIAFAILFGNECREGWTMFFTAVRQWHPTFNKCQTTLISDQAKGLIDSIEEVMNLVGHFFCSYHRRQNIRTKVRGGSGPYSCMWMYNKLMRANNVEELNEIKHQHSSHMSDKALRYLNTINDHQQYPCARVSMGEDICMYQRSASSSVESMNNANKSVRARTAVDPVNSCLLLLQKENERFLSHRVDAYEWKDELTPHGVKLRNEIFKKVEYCEYSISIVNGIERVTCTVARVGKVARECYFLVVPIMDSVFGGCTCGSPKVNGVPCHHMIAVVKSSRVEGLTSTNAMPCWWYTKKWRNQYPQGQIGSNINMSSLTANHTADPTWRYCQPSIAPRKAGRPKTETRFKSPVELTKQKKAKVSVQQEMTKESKKAARMKKGEKLAKKRKTSD